MRINLGTVCSTNTSYIRKEKASAETRTLRYCFRRDELLAVALQSAEGVSRARIEFEMRHAATTQAILDAGRSQRAADVVPEGVPLETEPQPETEAASGLVRQL